MLQPRRALARAALAAACGATLVPIAGALTGAPPAGATVVVADDLRGAGTVSVAQQALSALQHGDEVAVRRPPPARGRAGRAGRRASTRGSSTRSGAWPTRAGW